MNKDLIYELLRKYLERKLTKDEEKKLTELLNNHDNFEFPNELFKELWENMGEESLDLNSMKLWKNLKSKISEDSEIVLSKKFTFIDFLHTCMKYAAVIIILIMGIYVLKPYIKYNKKENYSHEEIQYFVPFGSKSNLILLDGTKVWINSGSIFKYSKNYGINNRIVFLEGEAYFEVMTDRKMPFCVKVGENITIKAYGTKFNVRSLKEEKKVETILISGQVVIEKTDEKGKIVKNIKMKPNEIVRYSKQEDKFTIIRERNLNDEHCLINKSKFAEIIVNPFVVKDIESAVAWKSNRLIFRSEDIESIIIKLERWYNVEIKLKNEKLKEYRFTGSFDNETIEQALEALKLTAPFSYTINKNKIIIY